MNTVYRAPTAVRLYASVAALVVTLATLSGVTSMAPSDEAVTMAGTATVSPVA
jgi:hypothetical protein